MPTKNREDRLKYNREYYRKNKNTKFKEYREKNKDKIRAYTKKYREENLEYFVRKNKEHYEKNKESASEYRFNNFIKKMYGISREDYDKMLEEQKDCCAICGKHKNNFKQKLSVDHNHETGKVRKLLCPNCNHGIGNFMDDINLLHKAIEYLEEEVD